MEKMSIYGNVHMSKIMSMTIKVGIPMYATYANCQTLYVNVNQLIRLKDTT